VDVLRHTAFFIHRDTITEQQKLAMLRGLAFLRMECAGVRAGDYGPDLLGGSSRLLAVPPWRRTPRWRGRREGPPSHYDVALHLDFDDETGMALYLADEAHRAVSRFNASVNVPELTARVDWRYEGAPLIRRGLVRHTAMFVWADDAPDTGRSRALDAASGLAKAPGVVSAAIGENVGTHAANFDWIVDVQIQDPAAARELVDGPLYAEAMALIAPATKYEWTARVTHVMRGY
jgi:hypothetical protein